METVALVMAAFAVGGLLGWRVGAAGGAARWEAGATDMRRRARGECQRLAALWQDEVMPPHIVAEWRTALDGRTFGNGRGAAAFDCADAVLRLPTTPEPR